MNWKALRCVGGFFQSERKECQTFADQPLSAVLNCHFVFPYLGYNDTVVGSAIYIKHPLHPPLPLHLLKRLRKLIIPFISASLV